MYGILWDEFLKQYYGFNLNFINFSLNHKKINNIKLNNFKTLESNKFLNNIEKNISIYDKKLGLSKDSEISSIITGNLLSKYGYIKEINSLNDFNESYEIGGYRRFGNWIQDGIRDEKKNKKYFNIENSKKKNKIKKFYKKKLLRISIHKSKLIKKTIKYIKKYNETPVGFKYNKIPISTYLPYIKRKFLIKNEDIYLKNSYPKKKEWYNKKNSKTNFLNRSYYTNLKKWNSNKEKKRFFNGKKYLQRLYSKYNLSSLNNFLDINNKKKKDLSNLNLKKFSMIKKKEFYYDKDSFLLYSLNRYDNVKRNLKKTNTKFSSWSKRFKNFKKTTFLKYNTKKDYKKLRNFKTFFKYNSLSEILGGRLPIINGNSNKLLEIITNIQKYKNRIGKNFGKYSIYSNPSIKNSRSSHKDLKSFIDKSSESIFNRKKKIYSLSNNISSWGLSKYLKSSGIDYSFFENSLNFKISNFNKISSFYKLKTYNKFDLNRIYPNYGEFWEGLPNLWILSDSKVFYDNYIKKNNYNSNSIEDFLFNIKKSSFSGLTDNSYNYKNIIENLNINSMVLNKKKSFNLFIKNKKNIRNNNIYILILKNILKNKLKTNNLNNILLPTFNKIIDINNLNFKLFIKKINYLEEINYSLLIFKIFKNYSFFFIIYLIIFIII